MQSRVGVGMRLRISSHPTGTTQHENWLRGTCLLGIPIVSGEPLMKRGKHREQSGWTLPYKSTSHKQGLTFSDAYTRWPTGSGDLDQDPSV